VAWVKRADDQLALQIELHVLVLPVAVLAEDPRGLERVQRLGVRLVRDVVGPEAVATGGHEHVPARDGVELALHDLGGVRDTPDVLERIRDRRAGR
jgi:hypothetical protein